MLRYSIVKCFQAVDRPSSSTLDPDLHPGRIPANMHAPSDTPLVIVVLAAGKGTRMKSSLPKVLHTLRGRPLLDHVLDTASSLHPRSILVVAGHGREAVEALVGSRPGPLRTLLQEPQLGTGHAVAQCLETLAGFEGTVAVLSGDVPGLRPETLRALITARRAEGAAISVLTGVLENPTGYGRILRDREGRVLEIREQKDLSPGQETVQEVNFGVYAMDGAFLSRELPHLRNENAQGEYYITDLVRMAAESGAGAVTHTTEDHSEATGVNTLRELSAMDKKMNRQYLEKIMESGVRVLDPDQTWIEDTVTVEADAVIHPMTFLYGKTRIGTGTVINPGAVITDSVLGRDVEVKPHCVISGSTIADGASVGPFAHLRPGSDIGPSAKIGNYVETKQAVIGEGSKVSHLTYVGDSELGKNVNIGAGCVTCNYDGFGKHRTVIEDGVFVGSGTMMVAPLTIGRGSLVAAGSTLTHDVPPDALAIARSQQSVKEGWAAARREKLTARKKEGQG